jgi:hypothetical protein
MQAMDEVLRNRRYFQFSLRTLFALMTILCVWLGYQLNWIRERHKALGELQQSSVLFDTHKPAPWSIRLIERGVPSIAVDRDVARDARKVRQLKRLFPEATICTTIDGLPVSRSPNPGFALKAL